MSIIDQSKIDGLESGVNQALASIETALANEVYAESIPLVGDQLKTAFDQGAAALKQISQLKSAVFAGLNALNNPSGYELSDIETSVQNFLDSYGLSSIHVSATQPSDGNVQLNFTGSDNQTYTQTLDSALGLPAGLNIHTGGTAQAALSYNFNLGVGIDSTGFYVDTSASNEISLGVSFTAPNLSADAHLGFLNFSATDQGSSMVGSFAVNLKDADGKLRLNELGGDLLDATLTATADINLHLAGDMGTAALPHISADLNVDWSFSNAAVNGTGDNSSFGGKPTVAFNNVEYDFGTFITDFVKPVLDTLNSVLQPVHEALAVFRTDLSFLKLVPDWQHILDKTGADDGSPDGKITLLDFVALAGVSTADTAKAAQVIDLIDNIVDWAAWFQGKDFGPDAYDLGSYIIPEDIRAGAFDLANVAIQSGLITDTSPLANFLNSLGGTGDGTGYTSDFTKDGVTVSGVDLVTSIVNGPSFDFPILHDPSEALKLLFGQHADLMTLDLPQINFGFGSFDSNGNPTTSDILTIPLFPLVDAKVGAAFQIGVDLAFGYDTRGLEQFVQSNFTDYGSVLNGLYFSDQVDGNGVDHPEISIQAAIELAVQAGIPIANIGGGGNIVGQVYLDLADSLVNSGPEGADGKLYVDEFTNAFLTNPFSLFDVYGRITAGLNFYVNAPWGNLARFNSPRLTLVDFSYVQGAGADPLPPPHLAQVVGDTLLLNMGDHAGDRAISDKTDGDETFDVRLGGGGAIVTAFGQSETFTGVTSITANGGEGDDQIQIDAGVTLDATLHGNAGDDSLFGGAGNDVLMGDDGGDYLLGGAGNDSLQGGNGDDVLDGGAGADAFDGGAGFDVVTYDSSTEAITIDLGAGTGTGDAAGDTFVGIEAIEGTKYDDHMTGGAGNDILFGHDGNDVLAGGAGDDILVGGVGADAMDGGSGTDSASYFNSASGVTLSLLDGVGTGGDAAGDTYVSIEQVEGSGFNDDITGSASADYLLGGGGNDHLQGGGGDDYLRGDGGADVLDGGAGADMASYYTSADGVTVNLATGTGSGGDAAGDQLISIERVEGSNTAGDTLTGDDNANDLYGWGGDDTLNGAGGTDNLDGGAGADTLNGGEGDDVLTGGAGADTLNGGAGNDTASYLQSTETVTVDLNSGVGAGGDAEGDTLVSVENIIGSNVAGFGDGLFGNDVRNVLNGMGGDDALFGLGGDDELHGGTGNDALYGGDGNDSLEGGAGNDTLDGGDGAHDVLIYTNSTSGVVVNLTTSSQSSDSGTIGAMKARDGMGGVDTLAAFEDVQGSAYADTLYATAGGSILTGNDGADKLYGGAGADTLVGGRGADTLNGGAGNDLLEGNEGADTLNGGADIDLAVYSHDTAAVSVNLTSNTALDGSGATDTLSNIEGAIGSDYGDTLIGSANRDYLYGGAGNDYIDGAAGNDYMDGGAGDDTYIVRDSGDQPVDTGGGTDLVISYIDYSIYPYNGIENLTLTGPARYGQGNDGANTIIGTSGDDTLDGAGGADDLRGGAGNDTYVFDNWGDRATEVSGGGTDLIQVQTSGLDNSASRFSIDNADPNTAWGSYIENVTLVDNARDLDIRGNSLANTLIGNTRNNAIEGLGGDDTIDPGAGRDSVDGGAGNDLLKVDWSASTMNLGTASFAGDAASGYSLFYYESDYYYFNRVDVANVERFEFRAGSGNDYIQTGDNNDKVWGGDGNDWIVTGKGADVVDGGAGNDRWEADKSDATSGQAINVDLTQSVQSTYLTGGSLTNVEMLSLKTGAAADTIVTLGGADYLYLQTGGFDDNIQSGGGNDTVTLAGGRDSVDLGSGTDTLILDWSAQSLNLGTTSFAGNNTDGYSGFYFASDYYYYARADFAGVEKFDLRGGSGSDYLQSGDYNDKVSGGDGNDTLVTGQGVDIVDGGAGNDRWQADKSFATASQGITVDLTKVNQSTYLTTGTVKGIEMLTLQTGAGADNIVTLGGNALAYLQTGGFDDSLQTGAGNDTVTLAGGRDNVDLGSGTDTLILDWTAQTLDLGTASFAGNATDGYSGLYFASDYYYYARADFAGVEKFDLRGGSGSDYLRSGDYNDKVSGGDGNDWLVTGQGVDIIDGGAGNDRWEADKSFATATQGITIDLTKVNQSTYLTTGTVKGIEMLTLQTGAGADNIITLGGNALAYLQTGGFDDSLQTGAGNDTVTLAGGRDNVDLGSGTDTLILDWTAQTLDLGTAGFAGNATDGYSGFYFASDYYYYARADFAGVEKFDLRGGSGNDTLRTGDNDDKLSGGAGNDWLISGKGADTIDGGSGVDYWTTDQSDVTAGMTIDLTSATASTWSVGARTGSVQGIEGIQISTGSGDDVLITRSDFLADTVSTAAGDDIVKVAGGRDSVDTGAGFDTLVIDWSDKGGEIFTNSLGGSLAAGYGGAFYQATDSYSGDRVDYTGVERFDVTLAGGNDTVTLGDADDVLRGGAGDDTLNPGLGANIVDGGAGNDYLIADISATTTSVTLDLNSDATVTYGIDGRTGSLHGFEVVNLDLGSGNDVVVTRADNFNDSIRTHDGDDVVTIVNGRDAIDLGAGFDKVILDWSWRTDNVATSLGGNAVDGYSGAFYWANDSYNHARLDFSGVEQFDVTTGSGNDAIRVGDGDDHIVAGAGDDTVYTGLGADVVDGGDGVDTLVADKSATTSNVTLDLNDPNRVSLYDIGGRTGSFQAFEIINLSLGSGADVVTTSVGDYNDVLDTGAGNDLVIVNNGRDTVAMGTGYDKIVVNWDWRTDSVATGLGGNATDGYSGAFYWANDSYNHARLDFSGVEQFDITTGSGNDTIRVGDNNDHVVTGAGDDTVYTGLGADVVDAGDGIDYLVADKSATTTDVHLDFNNPTQIVQYDIGGSTGSFKGFEYANLSLGSGDDVIITNTNAYSDTLDTGAGNDVVVIYDGRDNVSMGAGFDTIVVNWGWRTDSVDMALGGNLADGYSGQIYWHDNVYDHANLVYSGVERFEITTGSGSDVIRTGDGNDIILTGAGDDSIYSASGADFIDGGAGNDYWQADLSATTTGISLDLNTGAAAAWTYGDGVGVVQNIEAVSLSLGSGADTVITSHSVYYDTLSMGAGDDVVTVFNGRDTVDFGAGDDRVILDWSDATVDIGSSLGGDLAGGFSGQFYLPGDYYGPRNLSYSGVERFDVTTGSGNDSVYVGAGDDVVHTGLGNDAIYSQGGADVIDAGGGIDYWNADLSAATLGMTLDFRAGAGTSTFDIGGRTGSVTGVEYVALTTGSGDDVVLTDNSYGDVISTLGGDDVVRVAGGRDTVDLGVGDDLLVIDWSASGARFASSLGGDLAGGYSGQFYTPDDYYGGWNVQFSGVERFDLTLGAGDDNITLGAGNDILRGGAGNDTLNGGAGDDIIDGGTGNDVIDGGDGFDRVSFASSTSGLTLNLATNPTGLGGDTWSNVEGFILTDKADTFVGGAGDDWVEGGGGADNLNGGAGNDTAAYTQATAAVTVSLAITGAQVTGGAGTDTLTSIENLTGSAFNDVLTGDSGANVLQGLGGDDTLKGGLGADTLDGGDGVDTASYVDATAAVTVNLAIGTASGGFGTDTLISIENLIGSSFNDKLTGDGGDNVLEGGDGNDILDGGAGNDTASYASATVAVTVDLTKSGAQNTGKAGVDTLIGIENLIGGSRADSLTGDGGANVLIGGAGNDTLKGGDGDDRLLGGLGSDILNGGAGFDTAVYGDANAAVTVDLKKARAQNTGGAGSDTLSGIEAVEGSRFGDVLSGGFGDDTLSGMAGDDILKGRTGVNILDGGDGNDTASYADATDAVTVSLAISGPQDTGGAGTDSLISIENLIGSGHDDILGAASGDNRLDGGAGNDTVSYAAATAGVTVSLAVSGAQSTGGSGSDTLVSIENLTGSTYNDVLTGNAGANVIDGGLGVNALDGGAGVDTLSYASAAAGVTVSLAATGPQVTGGGSVDTVTGFENLRGSDFSDKLTGDAGANVLDGGAGNDVLDGGDGSDTASYASATAGVTVSLSILGPQDTGGAGVDTLSNIENLTGSVFGDELTGDGGSNVLTGGAGGDLLEGGAGNDVLIGGSGIDTASYASATAGVTINLALSGPQNTGGAGTDTLTSIEHVVGSAYGDRLLGGAGNDILDGGDGDDFIRGGAGKDVMSGGAGFDTVAYDNATEGVTVTLTGGPQGTVGAGQDTLAGFEAILGSAFDDVLTGSNGDNTLTGGAGNDTLRGSDGNDLLIGGLGDDSLQGGAGSDTAGYADATAGVTVSLAIAGAQNTGAAGMDTLVAMENLLGSSFDDILTGDLNANVLTGGAGNDVLSGGSGADNLYGDSGDDTLRGGLGSDLLDGGAGSNTAAYDDATSAVTVSLAIVGAQITGGAGTDTLVSIQNLVGSGFNDKLTGDAGDNVIEGGAGNDILVGGGGNDTASYAGATSGVTVSLATTSAQNTVSAGTDTLSGFVALLGSTHDDSLLGSSGDDILDGGLGNDSLNGGAGNDTASYGSAVGSVTVNLGLGTSDGANGHDSFVSIENVLGSSYDDTLIGGAGSHIIDGGAGNDTLSFAGYTAAVTVDLGVAGPQTVAAGETDVIRNIEALLGSAYGDVLSGGAGNDVIDGGGGEDMVSYASATAAVTIDLSKTLQSTGGAGTDKLFNIEDVTGSAFDDVLSGNAGSNVLVGGGGNDVLKGMDGDDTLVGGLGDDTLQGGNGIDTASYATASGSVTVSLAAGTATGAAGSDTLLSIEKVIGSDYADSLSGSAGNDVLVGGAGDDIIDGGAGRDTITGGAGADTLTGGAGVDTFVYLAAADSAAGHGDTITDFVSGSDIIDLSGIDADPNTGGDQAFTWKGPNAFTGSAGQLRYFSDGAGIHVQADLNGDMVADFEILLAGAGTLKQADFIL